MRTEAWVLHEGQGTTPPERAELKLEEITLPALGDRDVRAKPIYGCWETNVMHALERSPIDICTFRRDPSVVIGNSGVVQVLEIGKGVTNVRAGDLCIVFPNGVPDKYGYMKCAYGYDAPGSIGVMAKTTTMPEWCVVPIPERTRYTLRQWAAFSARYVTAWSSWNTSIGCYRTQMTVDDMPSPYVWAWGGGVGLAELTLAAKHGARVAMIASQGDRLALLEQHGIDPIDRRQFADLAFDEARYDSDPAYRDRYRKSEKTFLEIVKAKTGGEGVSIFIDNIGTPVYRATLKALSRQGVITTCGWRAGMSLQVVRAIEAIARHIHVFTHFARYSEGVAAVAWAEANDWMPPDDARTVYPWADVLEAAPMTSSTIATARTSRSIK